jgi:hypothetical protein
MVGISDMVRQAVSTPSTQVNSAQGSALLQKGIARLDKAVVDSDVKISALGSARIKLEKLGEASKAVVKTNTESKTDTQTSTKEFIAAFNAVQQSQSTTGISKSAVKGMQADIAKYSTELSKVGITVKSDKSLIISDNTKFTNNTELSAVIKKVATGIASTVSREGLKLDKLVSKESNHNETMLKQRESLIKSNAMFGQPAGIQAYQKMILGG